MISEIRGFSRRYIFNIKKLASDLIRQRKSISFDNVEQRSLSHLILSFFCGPSLQLLTLDMTLAECQQSDVDIVPPALNFIEQKTPADIFSFEFRNIFQSVTLLNTRLQHKCFLVNCNKFFNLQLN